jgi:hypothetical protein
VPGAAYDPDIGAEAYRGMVERIRFVEELGFDWVTLLQDDVTRNIAGERPPANVGGVLPVSFCGGPDRVVEQIRRCRAEIGAGVLDQSLQDPGTGDVGTMMRALELFGKKVLPHIREI